MNSIDQFTIQLIGLFLIYLGIVNGSLIKTIKLKNYIMRNPYNIIFFSFILFVFSAPSIAQNMAYKASVNEEGKISVEKTYHQPNSNEKSALQPKAGFPVGAPANPSFKNFRGAAIADIDADGADEIIFGANSTLIAIKGNGEILWSRVLSGTIIYPPSVADMDGDASLEIIVNTGGSPNAGRVYLLDNNGNDLAGWPQNFDQHWMFNAPAIADLNGDDVMEVITCERGNSTSGFLHVIKLDGSPYSLTWPLELPGNLAFTPSIGDIDNNGVQNIVIAISSGALYALNPDGSILDGFPVTEANKSFSYQSPMLYDFDGDGTLEIVGARHGDQADYYMIQSDGSYATGWPITNPLGWRYSPTTVVSSINGNGEAGIFLGHPNTDGSNPMDVIFGYKADGSYIDGFPINKIGGCESVISVADINNDGLKDLVFTDNMTDGFGFGYIHAYSIDGTGELEGFPLRPKGFTFMNAAVVGDIDGDALLDIACLSYTQFTGNDSIFITAYDLGIPADQQDIVFNGYKGNLLRDGLLHEDIGVGIDHPAIQSLWMGLSPNPSSDYLRIECLINDAHASIEMINYLGQTIKTIDTEGRNTILINTSHLQSGYYLVKLRSQELEISKKWLKL